MCQITLHFLYASKLTSLIYTIPYSYCDITGDNTWTFLLTAQDCNFQFHNYWENLWSPLKRDSERHGCDQNLCGKSFVIHCETQIIRLSPFCIQQLPFMQERNVTGRRTSTVCNFIVNILFHFLLSICGSLSGCWEGTGTLWVMRPMWFTILGHKQESWRSITFNENVLILPNIIYFYLLKFQHPIQQVWGENLSLGGVKLTTHVDPVTRLRVGGVIPPVPIYAFLECIGTAYEQLYFFSTLLKCVDKLGIFQTFQKHNPSSLSANSNKRH